jgi:hypothetical protein
MKQKRIILVIIIILAAAAAVLAILHLTQNKPVEQGQVEIIRQNQKWLLGAADIAKVSVKGELVNGKGETISVDTKGIALADMLTSIGIDPAKVTVLKITSQDEYSAEISGDELLEDGKVYLTSDGDGTFTLVVFGDSNSKRKVKDVARIEVDPE